MAVPPAQHQQFMAMPKLDSPIVDLSSGDVTIPWYQLFIRMWQLLGASNNATPVTELVSASIPAAPGGLIGGTATPGTGIPIFPTSPIVVTASNIQLGPIAGLTVLGNPSGVPGLANPVSQTQLAGMVVDFVTPTASLATPGSITFKLSGTLSELIVKWGVASVSSGHSAAVVFGTAFPTGRLAGPFIVPSGLTAAPLLSWGYGSASVAGFTLWTGNSSTGGTVTATFDWVVIGF